MTKEKILAVIKMYEERLCKKGVPKIRMNIKRTFKSLTEDEALAHAHFLTDGAKEYAKNPEKRRKTGSHLAIIQACLSLAGWYTLEDLMNL